VVAPVADSVVLLPLHTNVLPVVVTLPSAPTATVTVVEPLQPLSDPLIVYVVVAVGDANTVPPVVVLSPVAGDQVNDEAPLATRVVVLPLHNEVLPEITMAGPALIATDLVVAAEQPLLPVPVTVYVVDTIGDAVTLAPLLALSVAAGDHVYVFAPDALMVVLVPLHTLEPPLVLIVGSGFTVTPIDLVFEQPFAVPVTT
jgi:hypothetical protein